MKKVKQQYRLFLSVDIEEKIKDLILDCQDKIESECGNNGFRFIPEENMHLTLHFLGDTPQHRVADLEEIVAESCRGLSAAPFTIGSSGSFVTRGVPKVIWAGIENGSILCKIHSRLKKQLQLNDFRVDKRKFVPHLTIAYVKNPPEKIMQPMLNIIPELITEKTETLCTSVSLKRSILKPEGAVHTTLFEYEL